MAAKVILNAIVRRFAYLLGVSKHSSVLKSHFMCTMFITRISIFKPLQFLDFLQNLKIVQVVLNIIKRNK